MKVVDVTVRLKNWNASVGMSAVSFPCAVHNIVVALCLDPRERTMQNRAFSHVVMDRQ